MKLIKIKGLFYNRACFENILCGSLKVKIKAMVELNFVQTSSIDFTQSADLISSGSPAARFLAVNIK